MAVPIEKTQGDSKKDTRLLKKMAEEARSYITSFRWCLPIKATYFAWGIGGVIAVFIFEFAEKIEGISDKTWIVVGDLPPIFQAVEPDDSVQNILEIYCMLMDSWVSAVRNNGDFSKVFPVSAARTKEHADMLESRLALLRKEIIPESPADLVTDASGALKFAN